MAYDEALAQRIRDLLHDEPADDVLAAWVERGASYAATLPAE
ncbi:hypothetical protein ACFQ0K_17475 [Nocardioides caeni]|nr:hypothetical protein [Nocardioides caeni]